MKKKKHWKKEENERKMGGNFNVAIKILVLLESNFSTTATLGTEEGGHCREVEAVGREGYHMIPILLW